MNLLHIKLKNGQDILAKEVKTKSEAIIIKDPLQIDIDPVRGLFGKSWDLLSRPDTLKLGLEHIIFCYPATELAYEYYDEFSFKVHKTEGSNEYNDEDVNELEELFSALMQSKNSIIH